MPCSSQPTPPAPAWTPSGRFDQTSPIDGRFERDIKESKGRVPFGVGAFGCAGCAGMQCPPSNVLNFQRRSPARFHLPSLRFQLTGARWRARCPIPRRDWLEQRKANVLFAFPEANTTWGALLQAAFGDKPFRHHAQRDIGVKGDASGRVCDGDIRPRAHGRRGSAAGRGARENNCRAVRGSPRERRGHSWRVEGGPDRLDGFGSCVRHRGVGGRGSADGAAGCALKRVARVAATIADLQNVSPDDGTRDAHGDAGEG